MPDPTDPPEDFVARYRREERERKSRVSASGLGLEFAAGVVVPTLIGYGLDRWQDWFPVATLVGFFLGMAAAFYRLISASRRLIK